MSTAKLELARAPTTTTAKIRLGSAVLLLPSGSSSSLASSGAQEPFLPFPPRRQSIAGSNGLTLISTSVNRSTLSSAHEPSSLSSRRREHQRRSLSTNAPIPLAALGGATSPVGSFSTGPDQTQDTAVTGSSSSSARSKLAQMQTIDSFHIRAEGPERTIKQASLAWPHGEDNTAISNDGPDGAAVRRLTEALREQEILGKLAQYFSSHKIGAFWFGERGGRSLREREGREGAHPLLSSLKRIWDYRRLSLRSVSFRSGRKRKHAMSSQTSLLPSTVRRRRRKAKRDERVP